jgi:hypothetical protein
MRGCMGVPARQKLFQARWRHPALFRLAPARRLLRAVTQNAASPSGCQAFLQSLPLCFIISRPWGACVSLNSLGMDASRFKDGITNAVGVLYSVVAPRVSCCLRPNIACHRCVESHDDEDRPLCRPNVVAFAALLLIFAPVEDASEPQCREGVMTVSHRR